MFLKHATASQTVMIGPFLDKTNGVDPEISLTIIASDIKLSKAGAAFVSANSSGATVSGTSGWYTVVLDATDTATVGELILEVTDSTEHLPVYHRYQVVEEAIYDGLFAASAGTAGQMLPVESLEIANKAIGFSGGKFTAS